MSPATACDCSRLLATGRDCLRLLATARDCLQPPATARNCSQLLATGRDCLRLLATARNCLQLAATARNCSQLAAAFTVFFQWLPSPCFSIFEGIFDEIGLSARVTRLGSLITRMKKSQKPHTKYQFCHVIRQVLHKSSASVERGSWAGSLKVLSCHARR